MFSRLRQTTLDGIHSPIFRILAGVGSGQFITLAGLPLVLRLYSPGDYGLYTVATAIAVPLAPILSLRYEVMIPLPPADRDAWALAKISLSLSSLSTVVSCLGLIIVGSTFARANNALLSWLWIVPVLAWSMIIFQTADILAIRNKQYGAIARRGVLLASVTLGAQCILSFVHIGGLGLAVGFVIGQLIATCALLAGRPQRSRGKASLSSMRSLIRAYSYAPKHLVTAGVVSALAQQIPAMVIARWFGLDAAGQFGLAQRVTSGPVSLLSQSVGSFYLSELSDRVRNGRVRAARELFRRQSLRLGVFGAIACGLLLVAAPLIVPFLFGNQWTTAGFVMQALAPLLFCQTLVLPLGQTLIVTKHTHAQMVLDIARFILVLGSLWLASLLGMAIVPAIWLMSISASIAYFTIWVFSANSVSKLSSPDGSTQ